MSDELWMEVCDILQETVIKTIPKKKKCNKAKWLSEEALQRAVKRREVSKGEKERYKYLNPEFQRISRRDKKAFLSDQCKEIEKNNRMERLEISSRKLEIPREYFRQVKVKVFKLCPTLCNPMDCIVIGILQTRILERVAFPFSRGSSQPRD